MTEENKIELSSRGKRQLKDVLYNEIKEYVDELIEPLIKSTIQREIKRKIEKFSSWDLEKLFKNEIKTLYWQDMENILKTMEFENFLKEKIDSYLHKKWACGLVPFDDQFDKALKKAIIDIIKEK